MPRNSRQLSPSYCYHMMLRGINRSNLFEDDNDRNRFLSILERCCAETETQLYAWCLMSNHVHLLLRAEDGPGGLIKKIGCSYVPYFNKKYDRDSQNVKKEPSPIHTKRSTPIIPLTDSVG